MSREIGRQFAAEELRRFFTAVDRHLTAPARIIVLGGSAIALYGVQSGTIDIDTWETDLSPLQSAIQLAREETGLDIPVSDTGVADVPFASRLHRVKGRWTHLKVSTLERHDLVLSKTMRAQETDLAAIEKLHELSPLDMDTLLTRYLHEMTHVIGNPQRLDQNFLLMIDRLYGEIAAERVSDTIRVHRRG